MAEPVTAELEPREPTSLPAYRLTRVTVDAVGGRAAEVARALAVLGFEVRVLRRRFVADSAAVGAQEANGHLRSLGFDGREFHLDDVLHDRDAA